MIDNLKQVIIYGTGNYYKVKRENIKRQYKIIAFLDKTVKPGERLEIENGKYAYHPLKVKEIPEIPILLMSTSYISMWKTLMEMGIDEERIIVGANLYPSYDPFEEQLKKMDGMIVLKNKMIILQTGKKTYSANTIGDWKGILQKWYLDNNEDLKMIQKLSVKPLSSNFGGERGTPVDRYYIEKFLEENRNVIKGEVAEIADDYYTKKFGSDITNSIVFHINGWGENVIQMNLETGEGISDNQVDCLICTQTIQMIFDLDNVIQNIYKLLKPGGYVLLTTHGISQLSMYDYRNWGEYWRLTCKSFELLLEKYFQKNNITVCSYGNVKTVIAMLYGCCIEDLRQEDFLYNDKQYPLILTAICRK